MTQLKSTPQSHNDKVTKTPITVAHGDGIGPEIMDATLRILSAANAAIEIEKIDIGEQLYNQGYTSGIGPEAWDSLRRTKVFLKAPITTPQGGGYKSLNVTIRKTLGLYANVRPCVSLSPFVDTHFPNMDVVIVRENEEDTYAGIEHQQTDEVVQCLKLISRPGCERICRYAFEYAKAHGRKKVTCFTKDNIMKLTDGMFHAVFDEVAKEYPEIENEHWIVDIGSAKLATAPEAFDVLVMPNLYGDILSDVAAQMTGSVGLAGSANIGREVAMFEAIHGSAPRHAGRNTANPSALLHGAIMMLVHIGQPKVAEAIHNAWLKTIEDGVHTPDIYSDTHSSKKVGTQEFADAIIERLGSEPEHLKAVRYDATMPSQDTFETAPTKPKHKQLVGVDVFVHRSDIAPAALAEQLQKSETANLKLKMITNRGVKVWPDGFDETFCTDHWRCRFRFVEAAQGSHAEMLQLMKGISESGLDFIKTENLYLFDDKPGFSLGQGE